MNLPRAITAVGVLTVAAAQAVQGQVPTPAVAGLPQVPTTRVLAIGRLTPIASAGAMRTVMPAEVRATVSLYLAGKLDQWYVRKDQAGVVFILNVTDVKEAHDLLERLPLGTAGLMAFDLIPLGPLAPLGLLLPAAAP